MPALADRIHALELASPPTGFESGSVLPPEWVAEALAIFRDDEFLRLPMDRQSSFLDFVQAAYISTYDPSAPQIAQEIQPIFQAHLRDGAMPLARLLKTYDLLYFLYWCASTSIEQQRGFDTHVVRPFSQYLKPSRRRDVTSGLQENRAVRLCYLTEFAYDAGGNALAHVIDAALSSLLEFYPGEYQLFVYAWMYKDEGFLRRIQSLGVTVRVFDLSEYAERQLLALRQAFFDDRIDAVLTDMNSAVPHYLYERRVAPVQIFFQLGLPFWGLQNLDAVFQGWQIQPERLGLDSRKCHVVPAPRFISSIRTDVHPDRVRRERQHFPESEQVIGFYGRLVKVTPGLCEIVRRVLLRHPGAIAVFGGTGNAAPIAEFVRKNQLEERVFVVNEFVDGHVWGHFLDVFLDTFPLAGGYSCREVMAKGTPIVHMRSDEMPNLNTFLDESLGADSLERYVEQVSRLLSDAGFYREAREKALQISREQSDLRPFASAFHAALHRVMEELPVCNVPFPAKPVTPGETAANILA
jgi:hypothetical protein